MQFKKERHKEPNNLAVTEYQQLFSYNAKKREV
jgi:hypothetical protein